NRLTAFAHKPAPIQVTYLGYPGTTGLATMDYRLTDDVLDPPGSDAYYVEKLVRLPRGVCCFAALEGAPDVNPLPALQAGHVTFGSLHRPNKLNAGVFDLWARVLHAVPTARLLMYRDSLRGASRDMV